MLEPIATLISIFLLPVSVLLAVDMDYFNSTPKTYASRNELFMLLLLLMCVPQAIKTILLWLARVTMVGV
jgi:hypothetical protein